MSDVIAPIVAEAEEPLSGPGPVQLPVDPDGLFNEREAADLDRTVRKTRSGASSSSSKPSLSSRIDNLKISTIRQHYYPEGGWGYVICVCAFLVNMLTSGLLLSYGILQREILKEFGEGNAEISKWLGSVSLSLGMLVSPAIVAFCRRKSTRLTAVFGGLVAALGCLFASFASQMHQVFLSYGFVMSLGLSMARVTASLMIGQYFKRRRQKVEIFVAGGAGCGLIAFSYSFANIIRILGWRLGLHAMTGLAAAPFFIGVCYRSASLYHPQRRAILHLKNQRKKIKEKSGASSKPPFFDTQPLRSRPILICMLAAALSALGLYTPFFHLVPLLISEGLDEDSLLLLQVHLGTSFMVGCLVYGFLLVRRSADCIVGGQNLCQAAMMCLGLSFLSIQAAKDYYGYVLFAWMYGLSCGGLHYSLKMLVFEKIRAKSFSRAWAYIELAQSIPVLVSIPLAGYISGNSYSKQGFYLGAGGNFAGALVLVLLRWTSRRTIGRDRGSCSTCASQPASSCCTHDFNILPSHPGSSSSGGHPKCQKTISFSDAVDVDDNSPRQYPYDGQHYEEDIAPDVNVDVEAVDENIVICYDDGRPTNGTVVVVADTKPVLARYGCGHLETDVTEGLLPLKRQMTVIEEVTSTV